MAQSIYKGRPGGEDGLYLKMQGKSKLDIRLGTDLCRSCRNQLILLRNACYLCNLLYAFPRILDIIMEHKSVGWGSAHGPHYGKD